MVSGAPGLTGRNSAQLSVTMSMTITARITMGMSEYSINIYVCVCMHVSPLRGVISLFTLKVSTEIS